MFVLYQTRMAPDFAHVSQLHEAFPDLRKPLRGQSNDVHLLRLPAR